LFEKSDEEITVDFVEAVLKMYPGIKKEDILSSAVARASNVFALSTLAYSENIPSVETNIDGLHILNSAQITNGTLNVNETVQLADNYIEKFVK
jgi:hypothetical protein